MTRQPLNSRPALAAGFALAAIGALSLSLGATRPLTARAIEQPSPPTPPAPLVKPANPPTGKSASEEAANWLDEIPVRDLNQRLKALTPADPNAYFLLAEEVASEARTRSARQLARHLYILSMHLDASSKQPTNLSTSACLGLSALARNDRERHWLAASARVLDTARRSDDPAKSKPRLSILQPTDQTAYDLATALGFARYGDGRRAEQLLNRPDVALLLQTYEGVLNAEGQVGAAQTMAGWIREWPTCPECKNRRVLSRTDGPGTPVRVRLCSTCSGMPGPQLSTDDLIAMLRTESALLRGIHRFWSSQYLVDLGTPLRDPTSASIAQTYRVDPALSVWRDGKWAAQP